MEYIGFLKDFRDVNNLNEQINKDIAKKNGLLLIEVNILAFLHNNPSCDTASDIVQYRGLKKGNVSSALASLESVGLVDIVSDPFDKRIKRIRILPKASEIINDIEQGRQTLMGILTSGMKAEAVPLLVSSLSLLGKNAREFMENNNGKEG